MLLKYGSKGSDVSYLQELLNQALPKNKLAVDGDFGDATEAAVKQYQKLHNLKVDGIVGMATLSALRGHGTDKYLKDSDLQAGAKRLNVPETVIRAIAEVETMGNGFLPDGRAKILFERHRMYAYVSQKYGKAKANDVMRKYPNICNTATGGYHGGAAEYMRLALAKQIDEDCALQSCSWGRFQLMGENWQNLGYKSVQDFVQQQNTNESLQFEAFMRFVEFKSGTVDGKKYTLLDALQQQNWHVVFTLYNGRNYKKLGYDSKFLRVLNRLDDKFLSKTA